MASKSHRDQATDDYIAQYKVAEFTSAGSSMKFCLVAEGRADLYVRLGAPEQAVRYFLRCLRQEECFFFALESLGSLYLADEETFPMAWQCFARILSVNPRHFPAYFRLTDAYIQADRLTEAAGQMAAVLHLDPDANYEADAHQYLGLLNLMQERFDEARLHFERALVLRRTRVHLLEW